MIEEPQIASWVGARCDFEEITPYRIKSNYKSYCPVPDPDPLFSFNVPYTDELLDEMSANQTRTGFYYLSPTCAPFRSAANTDSNLVAAIRTRLLKPAPMPGPMQVAIWSLLSEVDSSLQVGSTKDSYHQAVRLDSNPLGGFFKLRIPQHTKVVRTEQLEDAWISEAPSGKKKKYRDAMHTLRDHSMLDAVKMKARASKLSVKANEVLAKGVSVDDSTPLLLKPRFIVETSPIIQAAIAPSIKVCTVRLAEWWHKDAPSNPQWSFYYENTIYPALNVHRMNGKWLCETKVSLYYASKADQFDLGDWRTCAQQSPGIHFAVAGDDNYCVINYGEVIMFYDASSYDQSQGEGPLKNASRFASGLGMEDDELSVLQYSREIPYEARLKGNGEPDPLDRLLISRDKRQVQDSGGPTTTFTNGTNMGTGCVQSTALVLSTCGGIPTDPEDLENAYRNAFAGLGFSMTGGVVQRDTQAEFLKGAFLESYNGNFVWVPLPSRRCKAGKTFHSPVDIFNFGDMPKPDRQKVGNKLFMLDAAKQLRAFPRVPVLRTFVDKYMALEQDVDVVRLRGRRNYSSTILLGERKIPIPYSDFKVRSGTERQRTPEEPTSQQYTQLMADRYDLTDQDVDEMEMLELTSPLFSFLIHPGYLALAARDYA